MSNSSFHQLTLSIFSQLTALLQLKYQSQSPLPTTMLLAVSTIMLHYLLYMGLIQYPESRFAAVAKHLKVWSAYAAVSTLLAALFPDPATPVIYTFFGLLSAGQVLYVFGYKLGMEDKDEGENENENENENEEGKASKIEVCRRKVCRFLKNICSGVAKFFRPPPTSPLI